MTHIIPEYKLVGIFNKLVKLEPYDGVFCDELPSIDSA